MHISCNNKRDRRGIFVEKVWLDQYLPGVPAEVDPDTYDSLVDVFDQSVEKYRKRPAYISMGQTLSYAQLDEACRDFAAYLQGKLGLQKGARVAIMMPNILQYPVALFGVLRAGLTVVNVNPLYTPRELSHQLKDSGAEAIVILSNFANTLEQVVADTPVRHVVVTDLGDMLPFPKRSLVNFVVKRVKKLVPDYRLPGAVKFRQALSIGAGEAFNRVRLTNQDIAFLQYTGGTTGVSKGAVLTHRNIVANMLQAKAWIGSEMNEGEEVIITALPLYHIFSLTANCMVFMQGGGCNVLIANPRDIPGLIKEMSQVPFSAFTGVNTLFNALINDPEFAKLDFSRMRFTLGGGMAVQRTVAEKWQQITGITLVEAYGLTETSPAVCINPMNLDTYNGFAGLPVPSTDICVRDEAGNDVAQGEPGELCIKGPQVMRGYWQRPEETQKTFTEDGWLRTGDVVTVNEQGYIKIVDRSKDMILVSGFNVYPNEIEDVAVSHPGVLECAAIGQADDKSGEVVKLVVVKKDASLTAKQLIDHCRTQLTGYKVPKHVEFRDDLPKSNVGKILRRELRDDNNTKVAKAS